MNDGCGSDRIELVLEIEEVGTGPDGCPTVTATVSREHARWLAARLYQRIRITVEEPGT